MDYQLVRFKIDDLNDFVRGSLLALPDFQRDFVWGPARVVDLMQSIGREWPIGSILVLEGPAEFACKPLDFAPPVSSSSMKYLLLDGQQRITSIYQAIQDISDYVYYIDMSVLINGSLDDDYVFYMRRTAFEAKYPSIESRARQSYAKICEIYEAELFFEWLSHIEDNDIRKSLVKIRRNYVYGLNSGVYSVPATVLPSGISFGALAKIFEGLNTNAVRLTTADLLVAANLPKRLNLRVLWSDYQASDPNVDALDLDMLDVLKICALSERLAGNMAIRGIKQTDLVKVDAEIYRIRWLDSCTQLSQAITFASSYLGVKSSKLLPNSYSLVALSFALKFGLSKKELIEWWVSRILGETFAQSGHTRMLNEITQFNDPANHLEKQKIDYSRMQNELNAALSKNYSTNAYLARGILSMRVAVSTVENTTEPYEIGDRIKIVGPTGRPASSGDNLISDLQVVVKVKKTLNKFFTENSNFWYQDINLLITSLSTKV